MSTKTAPTLDDLATRLTSSRRNGSYVLSGATLGAQEMDDVLGSIGLLELVLDEPEIEKTADGLAVTGKADLLGMPGLDGRTTFSIEDGALSVALTASYPDGDGIQLLGLPWASVRDLSLALDVVGPSLPLPVVSMVLSGAIELKGHAAPIEVTLTPSFGEDTWLLRATDIPLPDLSALTGLFPGQDGKALLPPGFGRIDGLEIVELTCAFTPGDWTVRNVAATVGAPGKEWEPVSGGPKLRDVRLSLGLEFEEDDSTSVTASARATVALGDLELPVRVIRQPGDRWRMGVIGAHGFPRRKL